MKNCVGQAVRGSDFWKRENELAAIWKAIRSGSHILLAAPRRVGKTSIMFHLYDNPLDGYAVIYLDVESADSENEFWRKLFNALGEEEFANKLKKYSKTAFEKLKNIKIKKIAADGVEFGDGEALSYYSIFEEFIKELNSDLNSIKVSPLTSQEAIEFTGELCKSVAIFATKEAISYMLEKIEWLIPFYIQLIVQELKTISRQTVGEMVAKSDIDSAIGRVIEHKNHFEHWQSKLKEGFDKTSYLYAKEILNTISEENTIRSSQISNIAAKYNMDYDDAREVIHSLVYDGYINNNDDVKIYRFNSPILRIWWNKYVAN